MPSVKKQLPSLFNRLSEREQELVYELILRLLPDDIATAADRADIAAARQEYAQGQTVGLGDINWN
ncbi:hypothetical protein FACS1894139_07260 [Planctomycetales bacterium]|nr:hypothetical protein FACS1894107_11730 [Planctomycetales bacterium]GHT01890.1 hypothetical protein FACS1894108_15900 [Planctomycetales bacterium]GHT04692.1 hypothetical protein FACS1894139_07260 [Planctomycetales bacterium]